MTDKNVKERPILFSGPMVRAILAGQKKQTRRIMKPQPTGKQRVVEGLAHVTVGMDPREDGHTFYLADGVSPGTKVHCKFGRPFDRLWVRETFSNYDRICYAATEGRPHINGAAMAWTPCIYMQRKHSRITLEIENIRAERLHDITEEDATLEGFQPGYSTIGEGSKISSTYSAKDRFQYLWSSINGRGSWETNPWLWVISFRKLEAQK